MLAFSLGTVCTTTYKQCVDGINSEVTQRNAKELLELSNFIHRAKKTAKSTTFISIHTTAQTPTEESKFHLCGSLTELQERWSDRG